MAMVLDRLPHVRVGGVDVSRVARETIEEIGDDDVPGMAAEMAYHAILSVFPFLLLLAGITSIVDNVFPVGDLTQRIVDKASTVMPDDATSLLESFTREVVNSNGGWAMVIGLVGSLWAASSAIGTAMKGLNRAYDVHEKRGFVRRKIVALALTVVFLGSILGAAILIATGSVMAGGIGKALGWKSELVMLWNVATPIVALLMIIFAVAMLYWLGPSTDHKLKWITPGALVFVAGVIIGSYLFTLYISNFASYNRTYGSIGAVIILLVWLYWSSYLLFVGGELNAVLARRHDEEYRREEGAKPSPAGSRAQP